MSRLLQSWLLLLFAVAGLGACGQQTAQENVPGQQAAADADKPGGAIAAPSLTPALPAPKAAQNRLLDIAWLGKRLVTVGQHGVILSSANGSDWQQLASPVSTMLTRVRYTSAQQSWVLGYAQTILKSGDGGRSWRVVNHEPQGRALYDIFMLDARRGFAVGAYGSLLATSDGGESWQRRDFDFTDLGMHLNAILPLADGSLFITGERGVMARSTDQGESWQLLNAPYGGSFFGALPYGEKGVLVYGMRGNVFSAADLDACASADPATWDPYLRQIDLDPAEIAARGWRKYPSPVRESLFGGSKLPDGTVILVGVNGTTLKLPPQGGSLSQLDVPVDETLSAVLSYQGQLLAVGRRGVQILGASQ